MKTIIRKPDGDLISAAENNGFTEQLAQVKNVIAQVPGEADEFNWYWLCELKNGKYAMFYGGCDYTGWDCQSNLHYREGDLMVDVVNAVDFYDQTKKPIKSQILDQITGAQPYALREE